MLTDSFSWPLPGNPRAGKTGLSLALKSKQALPPTSQVTVEIKDKKRTLLVLNKSSPPDPTPPSSCSVSWVSADVRTVASLSGRGPVLPPVTWERVGLDHRFPCQPGVGEHWPHPRPTDSKTLGKRGLENLNKQPPPAHGATRPSWKILA